MDSLKLSTSVSVKGAVGKVGELANLNDNINIAALMDFAFGTAAVNVGDLIYHDRRILGASANETLDLTDGTLLDAFGDAVAFNLIRFVMFINRSDLVTAAHTVATETTLIFGNATNDWLFLNATGDMIPLLTGDAFVLSRNSTTGLDVVSGTGDELKVLNVIASEAQYDIILIGDAV